MNHIMENKVLASVRNKTVCFTGHRQMKAPLSEIKSNIVAAVEKLILKGYLYFATGGARGFDALASEVVLELKERYPQIHLILVLPFDEPYKKDKGWKPSEIAQYHRLKEHASMVIVLSSAYRSGVYYKRNRYLVDHASACVVYLTRINSGTGYTVNYARSNELEIINLASSKNFHHL